LETKIANSLENESLISPPLRDSLLVKISALQVQDTLDREKEKLQKSFEEKKRIYFADFNTLVKRYFKLSAEKVSCLSAEETEELREIIYEKAKRSLLWKKPLFWTASLAWLPAILFSFIFQGSMWVLNFILFFFSVGYFMIYGLDVLLGCDLCFSTSRFVALHKLHKEILDRNSNQKTIEAR